MHRILIKTKSYFCFFKSEPMEQNTHCVKSSKNKLKPWVWLWFLTTIVVYVICMQGFFCLLSLGTFLTRQDVFCSLMRI